MQRRGREDSAASCAAECFLRCAPAVLLPLLVAGMHPQPGVAKLPLVLVGAACGVVIAFAVPRLRYSLLAVVLVLVLLLSAAYVQELHLDLPGHHLPHAQHLQPLRAARGPGPAAGAPAPGPPASGPGAGRQAAGPGAGAGASLAKAAQQVASLRERAVPPPPPGELAPAELETLSVVLPCAFEGEFAGLTVDSILNNTKLERLREVIVVDDGSRPPLKTVFPARLLSRKRPPVRIIRHEKTLGLIGAKKSGGDAARGDVIVFFDCHIKPRLGWEDAFLKQMKRAGDHRTVVVPTITSLDPDTWEEVGGANGQACYVLWSADFTWLDHPGRDVPLMSGGLLAISRRWWQETEGYDEHMVAWGGENIDQSLRIWLCGGRIEVAEGAFVAHMWRDPHNPKTMLRYPIPTKDVMRNKARAAKAWFGDFSSKVFAFPEYEQFAKYGEPLGDMSNFEELQAKLQCAPFSSYIQRFSYVYLDSGLLPEQVFQLREAKSGLCLERLPQTTSTAKVNLVVLAPCSGAGGSEGPTSELQLWHPGNRDIRMPGKPCCSGIMNWNFLQCLDSMAVGAQVRTFECTINGGSPNQEFMLEGPDEGGQIVFQRSPDGTPPEGCIGPQEASLGDPKLVGGRGCALRVVFSGDDGGRRWARLRSGSLPARSKHRELCAAAIAHTSGTESASGFDLGFMPCDEADSQQLFQFVAKLGGFEVRVGAKNCLDSASGSSILVYPCYDESVHNMNQIWHVEGGRLEWKGRLGPRCLDLELLEEEQDEYAGGHFALQTCTPKEGQRFQRQDVLEDGTFVLRDPDLGTCLGAVDGSVHGGRDLALVECGQDQRWEELRDKEQVRHVASGLCLDGGKADSNDRVHLFACHRKTTQQSQRFEVVDVPGWVQWKMMWGDNGRKRWFPKCLDRQPVRPVSLALNSCAKTERLGWRWEKLSPRKPPEWETWEKVEKPAPGAPPLGGPFEPP